MNVVAEPTSAGGSVTLKFKQSTIDKTSYLAYITFTPTANRFFILDYTNSNIPSGVTVTFDSLLLNSSCNIENSGDVNTVFKKYSAGSSIPSPYTANSLAASDTKKIVYQTLNSVSSTYTIGITGFASASPTGITVTRASLGN